MEVYSQSGGIYKSFYKAKLSHFTKKRGFYLITKYERRRINFEKNTRLILDNPK